MPKLARLQPLIGRTGTRHDGAAALLIFIGIAGIGESLARHEALGGERLFTLILPLGALEREIGFKHRAIVRRARLGERQFLAAHRIELLRHLGLSRKHRELELCVREHCKQLPPLHGSAVFDQHLLDTAAFDRVEIDGD